MDGVSNPGMATGARRATRARCAKPTVFRGNVSRCGKCPHCRNISRWLKESFALWEAYGSERTWFVTLTFEKEPATEKEGYEHVQKWLKRVREKLDRKKGERIRFISVAEFGSKNKRLHYHCLLFVGSGVTYRDLPDWPNGHHKYKLADGKAIAYVMKYLTKDGVKYRASQKMGEEVAKKIRTHPLVESALQAFPGARISAVRYRGKTVALPVARPAKAEPSPEDAEFNAWLAKLQAYPSQKTSLEGLEDDDYPTTS